MKHSFHHILNKFLLDFHPHWVKNWSYVLNLTTIFDQCRAEYSLNLELQNLRCFLMFFIWNIYVHRCFSSSKIWMNTVSTYPPNVHNLLLAIIRYGLRKLGEGYLTVGCARLYCYYILYMYVYIKYLTV